MKLHTLAIGVHHTSYSYIRFLNRFHAAQSSKRQRIDIPIRNVFDLVIWTFDL